MKLNPKIFLFGIVFLVALLSFGINFSVNPTVTPADAQTGDNLLCRWTLFEPNGDLEANVTWFEDGIEQKQEQNISCTTGAECISPEGIAGGSVQRYENWNCSVHAGNGTEEVNMSYTLRISNADPVITAVANQEIKEDSYYTYDVNATDADAGGVDGDGITYLSYDKNNQGSAFDNLSNIGSSGLFSFTPLQEHIGNHTLVVVAVDGEEGDDKGSDAIEINFTVVEINDFPTFSPPLQNKNATEGSVFEYTIVIADEEDNTHNITMNTTSPSLQLANVATNQVQLTFPNGGAPTFFDRGIFDVNITVTDENNGSIQVNDSFILTVSSINQVPYFLSINNTQGTQGQPFLSYINTSDFDENDTMNFSIGSTCDLTNPWTITNLTTEKNSSHAIGTGVINISNLTNDYVVCRDINVTVYDIDPFTNLTKESNSTIYSLNITNINDVPVIYEMSYNESNSGDNINISDLESAVDYNFTYVVNVTDPDFLTYAGDVLEYTTNDSLFPIDNATGLINVTTNVSYFGNLTFLVNVTDSAGVNISITASIAVINNTIPVLDFINSTNCNEDEECLVYIDVYDPDPAETLTFYSNDSIFNITAFNSTTAKVQRMYLNAEVGNYSLLVWVEDKLGATDQQAFNLTINNTNDAPFFDNELDGTPDNFSLPPIVEESTTSLLLNVTDDDIIFGDNLTFAWSFQYGENVSNLWNFSVVKSSNNSFILNITPNESDNGIYWVLLNVSDMQNASDQKNISFQVFNVSTSPLFTSVKPYYNSSLGETLFTFADVSYYNGTNSTNINFTENNTITFDVVIEDNDTDLQNITLEYYWNGTRALNKTNVTADNNLTVSFDFFSSSSRNLTVVAEDFLGSNSEWSWIVEIENLNRPPILNGTIANYNITATTRISDYLIAFYDPDDDLDGDAYIDITGVENLTLTFSVLENSSIVQFEYINYDIVMRPSESGEVNVTFIATDADGASVYSNNVTIGIDYTPDEEETPNPLATTASGGGGGTNQQIITQTKYVEVEQPINLDILVTGAVEWDDAGFDAKVPVKIQNPSDETTLFRIVMEAETTATNVTLEFRDYFIPFLEPEQYFETELYIENDGYAGPYEVKVSAIVEDPEVTDTDIIFMSGDDKGSFARQRVSFAKDLLSSNPECKELNELLKRAEEKIDEGNPGEAKQLLDVVTEGCKYLVNSAKKHEDAPRGIVLQDLIKDKYINYMILGIIALMLGIILALIFYKPKEFR